MGVAPDPVWVRRTQRAVGAELGSNHVFTYYLSMSITRDVSHRARGNQGRIDADVACHWQTCAIVRTHNCDVCENIRSSHRGSATDEPQSAEASSRVRARSYA